MKTARYQKRCFDQIEGITTTNKELTAEVERLRRQLEAADQERTDQEAQNQNLVGQLKNKEREKTGKFSPYHSKCGTLCYFVLGSNSCNAGLEAEVTRLQGENSRALAECGRLKEDNEKLARRQSELQDHTNRMKDDLKSKHSRPPFSFNCPHCLVVSSRLMSCTVFSFESQCQEAPGGRDQGA